MRKLLFFLLSLMVLVACGGKKVQEQPDGDVIDATVNDTTTNDIINDTIIPTPTIVNDTMITKCYHKDETKDYTRLMEFEYYMPQLNRVAEDSIWRAIKCSLCTTYYDSLSREKTSIGMETDFFERINEDPTHRLYAIHYGRPAWVTENFVAYTTWECHFRSEGELSWHEYECVKHYLFDSKTGRRIIADEIFSRKGTADFLARINAELLEKLGEALMFPPTKLDNLSFTADTLTITYSPYAVTGYTLGFIELKYPMADVLPYMNKKSVIYRTVTK